MAKPAEGNADLDKSIKHERLIAEVITGELRRCRFDAWEIDVLLDIESCNLTRNPVARQRVLRQYQEAVHRRMADVPLMLSTYVESLKAARRTEPLQQRFSKSAGF